MLLFIVSEQIIKQMNEYLNHVQEYLLDKFGVESEQINYKAPFKVNNKYQVVIFIQQINQAIWNQIDKKSTKICLLNTEQATVHRYCTRTVQQIKQFRPWVIDYSLENIDILMKWCPDIQYIYLPFPITLPTDGTPKQHRVVTLGNSPQRTQQIQRIRALGIPVVDFNGTWGEKRDQLITQSKILINIHWSSEYAIFESIRCYHALEAGILVVSENTHNPDLLLLKDYIIFAKLQELPQKVKYVFENHSELYQQIFTLENSERVKQMFSQVYLLAVDKLMSERS